MKFHDNDTSLPMNKVLKAFAPSGMLGSVLGSQAAFLASSSFFTRSLFSIAWTTIVPNAYNPAS